MLYLNIVYDITLICLSYVCNLILLHIWDAFGFSSKIRCGSQTPCPRLKETLHAGASSHPPQYSSSQIRLNSYHRKGVCNAMLPRVSIETSGRSRKLTTSRCYIHTHDLPCQANKPRKSLSPSFDDVPHRRSPAKLSHPPQSAASLVVPRCRSRKHCHLTLSHAA
jgi:hypothetical protein